MVFSVDSKIGVRLIRPRNKMTQIIIFMLIVLEQGIKLIVKNYYNVKVPIIENILYFMPVLNEDYSWFNSMFQFGWSRFFHIALVLFVILFGYSFFKYLETKNLNKKITNTLKIFLFSGAICSLMDKIFWNGSLDYILLKGFFVFDLKDCYLTTFQVIIIIFAIKNRKTISKINEIELVKDYIGFIRNNKA